MKIVVGVPKGLSQVTPDAVLAPSWKVTGTRRYRPCANCTYQVRPKKDGMLYKHRAKGDSAWCLGSGCAPKDNNVYLVMRVSYVTG